jgi:hypothetical protein
MLQAAGMADAAVAGRTLTLRSRDGYALRSARRVLLLFHLGI